MITLGLTGGIASGKSTVADFFRESGAKVIDADQIAHEVVSVGKPAWASILDHFGRGILKPCGEIDRPALGRIVFGNSAQRAHLEQIVHPYVLAEMELQIRKTETKTPDAILVLDIPLFFESGLFAYIKEIVVVYISAELQLDRLMRRDNLTSKEALARIRAQLPLEKKKERATIVIDNGGSLKQTRKQTFEVYRRFKEESEKENGDAVPAVGTPF